MHKQALLNATPNTKEYDVDGVQGKVTMRAAPYAKVQEWMTSDTGDVDAVAHCVVDDDGAPMLSAEEVRELPAPLLKQLVEAALDVNGYGDVPKD
jgi:hypothetical protein